MDIHNHYDVKQRHCRRHGDVTSRRVSDGDLCYQLLLDDVKCGVYVTTATNGTTDSCHGVIGYVLKSKHVKQ